MKEVLEISLSEINESSIVELVNVTLLPVPSLNSEFVMITLFALLSKISPLVKVEEVIAILFAVLSLMTESDIVVSVIVPSANEELSS